MVHGPASSSQMSKPPIVAVLACIAASHCAGELAWAQDSRATAECAAAYEAGQVHRAGGRLRDAMSQLDICHNTCPKELREDCGRWHREVAELVPAVVVRAQDETGRTLSDVELSIDGDRITEGKQREAIPLDLGRHVVVVRRPSTGVSARRVVELGKGETKELVVVLHAPPEPPPYSAAVAWTLGALGVAIGGVAVGVGVKARLDLTELEDTCSPRCPQSEADAVRQLYTTAAVLGAIGGVAFLTGMTMGITIATDGDGAAAAAWLSVGADGVIMGGRF